MKIDLDSRYADILELCLYNAVLTGMSSDGKAFTYVNQLASSDTDPSKRYEWFDCACCPPNVTRTLGLLGGYVWTFSPNTEAQSAMVNIHLYSSASLCFEVGRTMVSITQTTDWPWDGKINFSIVTEGDPVGLEIRLRIPGWSSSWEVRLETSIILRND